MLPQSAYHQKLTPILTLSLLSKCHHPRYSSAATCKERLPEYTNIPPDQGVPPRTLPHQTAGTPLNPDLQHQSTINIICHSKYTWLVFPICIPPSIPRGYTFSVI